MLFLKNLFLFTKKEDEAQQSNTAEKFGRPFKRSDFKNKAFKVGNFLDFLVKEFDFSIKIIMIKQ